MTLSRRAILKGASALAVTVATGPLLARPGRIAPRIDALIAAMSLEEKAGQLSIYSDPVRNDGAAVNPGLQRQGLVELKARIARGELTGLFNGSGVALGRALQQVAVEQTRHKIPLIFAGDVIHGFRTQFPIPLGEAASFDPSLAERTARAAAIEATARGLHWTFAPMVDVARDERWGRVAEGSGEDPWLGAQFGVARVKGFQGKDLRDPTSMLSCPKHFAAYGAVQGGMEYNTADIPLTTLWQVHLPPFRAAFDAGALSTMASFNDIAGVPSTGSHYLLTEVLRDQWGFHGLVVSDYTGDEELILHGYAADGPDAVVKALTAGCDISMQSGLYWKHLPDLARAGRVPMAVIDRAVRRVLAVKEALGLFDDPYRSLDPAREAADIRRPETVALAREAARKSVVLLKNDGGLLPLAKTGAIALIGPAVSDRADLPGPWAVFPDVANHVTIEEGFRAALGSGARLHVARGSDYEAPLAGGIAAAMAAARASDVIVLVVGESMSMSGEAQARVDIGVPAPQLALAEALAALGKPMVVLLRHGRALALTGAVRAAPAIMATWFLGSETGHALADLVFGDAAPQGRLPVSFPQASGQEPFFYDHRPTGRPQLTDDKAYKARYREVTNAPLYPFGHGLTYSTIAYGSTVAPARMAAGGALTVTATVTNTGHRPAHEVAQLYIHDRVAGITQPIRVLKGIRHLDLAPGQSATVAFTLTAADLGYVHADLTSYPDPGAFDVVIAPSATGGTPASFVLA
ncbi:MULTISPECIES: glycoside hydrolase family 3 N-terminal domain-containing protein [unclassified Sphingomonas]|uniref:glycoside hydrolase family 3 N-terminal domain-containing protein n=1 Tax=unclassified Sphingomonas TaxID=196159 RepID=UPI00226A7BE4|nr:MULTISPECIES: glycoside hydrolase family 3 N-terminal domain-containing protein [unclassified Sphingomonas]